MGINILDAYLQNIGENLRVFENIEIDEAEYTNIERDERIYDYTYHNQQIGNNRYYIGLPTYEENGLLVFGCNISAASFYRYNNHTVCEYLRDWSCSVNVSHNQYPEIMKLEIRNDYYLVSLKTFWLRIVQRRWKKIMQMRREINVHRLLIRNQRHLCNTGMHLPEYKNMPTLRGMLSGLR